MWGNAAGCMLIGPHTCECAGEGGPAMNVCNPEHIDPVQCHCNADVGNGVPAGTQMPTLPSGRGVTYIEGFDIGSQSTPSPGPERSTHGEQSYECVANINEPDCTALGGNWNDGGNCTGECDGEGDDCTNFGDDLCLSPCCSGGVACCKDGNCIGDSTGAGPLPPLSKILCEYVYGGIAVPGVCGLVDCCDATIYVGACCKDEYCESPTTAKLCKSSGGTFMGPNTDCGGAYPVNCCIVGGACCVEEVCWDVADVNACGDMNGIWQGQGSVCDMKTCVIPTGACCYPMGGGCYVITEAQCDAAGGDYNGDGTCCEVG